VNILLKQRLIGAIVLISLAVIFIPMLFTSQNEKGEQKFESSIPAEPSYEIKSPQVSVPLSLPPKSLEKVPLSEPQAADEVEDFQNDNPQEPLATVNPPPGEGHKYHQDQEPSQKQGSQTAEQKNSPPKSTPKSTASAAATPATVKAPAGMAKNDNVKSNEKTHEKTSEKTKATGNPAPATSASSKTTQAPVAATQASESTRANTSATASGKSPSATAEEKTASVTGWVVQVGSFSQKANAEKLRNQLREMGMASFVATGHSHGKTIYRVRVGPEFDHAEAEKLQANIKAKTKLNGLVMKYP
jgi:DedD protein